MKIGIITDIHEDVAGLEKALALFDQYQCDAIACLGDIAGFHPLFYPHIENRSAQKCLNLIRDNCRWIVAGNHDLYASLTEGNPIIVDEPGKIKRPLTDFPHPLVSFVKNWISYKGELPHDLNEESIRFLSGLPFGIIPDIPDIRCMFSHYIYPDLSGSTHHFIQFRNELKAARDFMLSLEISFVLTGHTHQKGLGIGLTEKISGHRRFLKAVKQFPFSTYDIGPENQLFLLPGIASEKHKSGISIFDSNQRQIHVIPLYN